MSFPLIYTVHCDVDDELDAFAARRANRYGRSDHTRSFLNMSKEILVSEEEDRKYLISLEDEAEAGVF